MADSKSKQQQDDTPVEETSVEHKFSTYKVVDLPETNPPSGRLVEQIPGKPSGE